MTVLQLWELVLYEVYILAGLGSPLPSPDLNTCVVSVLVWCSCDVRWSGQVLQTQDGHPHHVLLPGWDDWPVTLTTILASSCDDCSPCLQRRWSAPCWWYSGSTSSTSEHLSTTPCLAGRIYRLEVRVGWIVSILQVTDVKCSAIIVCLNTCVTILLICGVNKDYSGRHQDLK